MKYTAATIVGLAAVASASAPSAAAPAGCSPSYSGTFEITAYKVAAKRSVEEKRAALEITLNNGVLTDSSGRTGYIASNYQFQFDGPPQAGAIYTSGFSACSNGSLALGGSTTFYECRSGDFYNLYDRSWAAQCEPVDLVMSGSGSGAAVTQTADGQPEAPTAVSQISDGQPQAPSPIPISQISDGQVQVPTGKPISQISDGQVQVPTGKPVSQISDGQVQVPTATASPAPVSQISDGQVQVPTATAKPKPAPVSQISDGQVQVPTATATASPAPVSQISDGQVQVPTATAKPPSPPPVSQISDGQVQVPTNYPNSTLATVPASSPAAPSTLPSGTPSVVIGSLGTKTMPGVAAALFIAGLTAVLYL